MSWFRTMREQFMEFPTFYMVFDVETTGLSPSKDLVTQVGYCIVEECKAVACGSTILDWTRSPRVDQDWLRSRLATTKWQMETKGKPCHMTYERLREEGCNPLQVLDMYVAMLREAKARGDHYMGHNTFFDIPMLEGHFDDFGPSFTLDKSIVIDTGVMEKAHQLNVFPNQGESIQDFFRRIRRKRTPGIYWSLDSFCIPKYQLDTKHNLDVKQAHDAEFDCVVTHLLFEQFRELSVNEVDIGSEPVTANA
jgi:DNA polymerase III epsilon subunit-like protein